ncbi:putative riboflavin kinase [Bacillus rossius redtenbacheri]|uniref:putative riboflavin kinase n=1 Tax=Bacillus rossius redtenbacheri TaxID=93214 RepID=UPI002FDEA33F
MNQNGLPHFASGKVVKGFGRGSKELGIPTANFDEEVVNRLPESVETGVYFGWAQVDNGPVHKMVMSIGWNPFYKNTKKSMETHVLHEFQEDFYGATLKVFIVGRIRPEMNFSSVDELIAMIKNDIAVAEEELEKIELQAYRNSPQFSSDG